jgi:hypothetical protein
MNSCENDLSRIDLYLDEELRGEELEDFKRHLKECSRCQSQIKERQLFLQQVRAARPLYPARAEFRAEMAALLASPVSTPSVPASQHQAIDSEKNDTPFWLLWLRSRPIPALIAIPGQSA